VYIFKMSKPKTVVKRKKLDEDGKKSLDLWYSKNKTTEAVLLPPNITKCFYPTNECLGFAFSSGRQKKELAKLFFHFPKNFEGKKQDLVRENFFAVPHFRGSQRYT